MEPDRVFLDSAISSETLLRVLVMRYFFCLFLLFVFSHSANATILTKSEMEQADLGQLNQEASIFQSISMGIALLLAQCEGIDLCILSVDEDEISELINALDLRINKLILQQEEAEDPEAVDNILTAYMNERDNFGAHLEKLKTLSSDLDENRGFLDDSLELQVEPDFPIETARDAELLEYVNDLEFFEDEELEDDESEWDVPDLP